MSPHALTKDGFETQFAVKYLGHFLLTALLFPYPIEAGTEKKAVRIVCLFSIVHALGWFEIGDLQAK